MKKLEVSQEQAELNLKFYTFLKLLMQSGASDMQIDTIMDIISLNNQSIDVVIEQLSCFIDSFRSKKMIEVLHKLISIIKSDLDLRVFIFSLRLYLIKDFLLEEAKIMLISQKDELRKIPPLSLAYDEKSIFTPYALRVNGALLSLIFFERIEKGNTDFILSSSVSKYLKDMSNESIALKSVGIEPNQIFMLMFSESINQSIRSSAGKNYEERIENVLIQMGLSKDQIKKQHDKADKSTEFDFFFELEGKTYGIGAKKTLRERYKQFIKTALSSDIDVMIQITLGLDLNEEKAKTILSHGTFLFVSDEIYESRDFLRTLKGIYPVSQLNLETLKALGNKNII